MTMLATLIHCLKLTGINEIMFLVFFVWFGFAGTTALNKVLWQGEKIQFVFLNQVYFLVRGLVMGAVYGFIAFYLSFYFGEIIQ